MERGEEQASYQLVESPEGQQAVAQAVGMWLAGYSKREACRQTGVARTTLSRHLEKGGWTEADRAKYTAHVEQIAFKVAEEAGRQLIERLEDAETNLSPMQIATVFGIACDKVTAIHRLSTQDTGETSLTKILERLGQGGGRITLDVETARVIDGQVVREGRP
jgi:predicted XRE-type DNA-binding protein